MPLCGGSKALRGNLKEGASIHFSLRLSALTLAVSSFVSRALSVCSAGHATMAASLALFELFPRTRAFTFVGTRSGRRIPVSRTKRGAEFAVPAMSRPVPVELMTRQAVLQLLNHAAGLQERDIAELREVVSRDKEGS